MLILQQNRQIKLYPTHSKKNHHWTIVALLCASSQNSKIKLVSPHPSSSPLAPWWSMVGGPPLCSHSDCDPLTQQNRHLKNNTVHPCRLMYCSLAVTTSDPRGKQWRLEKSDFIRLVVTRCKGLLQPAESPGTKVLHLPCGVYKTPLPTSMQSS